MNGLLAKLVAGDRRSIGRSNEVVAEELSRPGLIALLFEGPFHGDSRVRMRAADAFEKVTAQRTDLLRPFRRPPLLQAAPISQKEVRWFVAQMLGRLQLTAAESRQAIDILLGYLDGDDSRILRV